MKVVEPYYEIWDCPDGEACLARLERIGRMAYQSEDQIDDGVGPCAACVGGGWVEEDAHRNKRCPECKGTGKSGERVREPSSHKFIRMILKTNRRQELYKRAEGLSTREVVDLVMNDLRSDPEHESVIEHVGITVLFGSNRGFTHELCRHRVGIALTQQSTRFCNYSRGKFGRQISVTFRPQEDFGKAPAVFADWVSGLEGAEAKYLKLVSEGVKPQIARDLLPQALLAPIVVTANLREWRHIFRLRTTMKAHPDMVRMMTRLQDELRQRIPIIFDEF